jgi:hypothetical protein
VSQNALLGALASLSCALTWAIASLVFAAALSQTKATAAGLGVVKAVIETPLLLLARAPWTSSSVETGIIFDGAPVPRWRSSLMRCLISSCTCMSA